MASARKMKNLLNKMWYRSKRGGRQVTPEKDLPWGLQQREDEGRKLDREMRKEKKLDSKLPGVQDAEQHRKVKIIETVIFVPAT